MKEVSILPISHMEGSPQTEGILANPCPLLQEKAVELKGTTELEKFQSAIRTLRRSLRIDIDNTNHFTDVSI